MHFKKYVESLTMIGKDIQKPPLPPEEDDDDDNDDDENGPFGFNALQKKYGSSLQEWIDNSSCSKKIKGILLEKLFKQKPKLHDIEIWEETERDMPKEGHVSLRVEWTYHEDKFIDALFNTVRNSSNCDLWKAFKIQPSELWAFLEKGRTFDVFYHMFIMSLSGINVPMLKQQNRSAEKYLSSEKSWVKDKLTIAKYAEYTGRLMIKTFEQQVSEYVLDQFNFLNKQNIDESELYLTDIKRRGQVYGENLLGEVNYIWDYLVR